MLSQHFTRAEFACRCGCGFDTVDADLLALLENVRDHFAVPVTINCGCRCPEHNRAVGGEPQSQHMRGRAADIVVRGVDPQAVADYVDTLGAAGVGRYATFTHVDTRSGRARWRG